MCILRPCADPTEVGVWWRDDTKWCLYGQTQATWIRRGIQSRLDSVNLGTIDSKVHPNGAPYVADLSRMEQIAVRTGQRRPIKIIDGPPTSPLQQSSDSSEVAVQTRSSRGTTSVRVHYRDPSGQLIQYDQDIADALLAVVGASQRSVAIEHKKSKRVLHFDLDTMEQRFLDSKGSTDSGEPVFSSDPARKVIVFVAWDPETMVQLVTKAEGTLRRKILIMTVERFRSEERLNARLPGIAHPRIIVGKKADRKSFPGHRSFEEFVDALEDKLSQCPDGIESFINYTASASGAEDSRVQMAFKPVERRKVGTKKMAFWRNMAGPMAAAQYAVFCGTAVLHIMAYLVILPDPLGEKEKKTSCAEEAEVVISRPDHYLSLAELSVQ